MSISICTFDNGTDRMEQVWYDNATTLRTKYQWAVRMGMRAVGMWTPGAAGFDESSSKRLWGSISPRIAV